MSGQLRALKNRIRSVESTKKITRAMEMVAAAKLHRFQDMMGKGQAYASGLGSLLQRLSQQENLSAIHPFLETREIQKIGVLVFTSDTGLCGSFNSDLISESFRFVKRQEKPVTLVGVGKFGVKAFSKQSYEFHRTFIDIRVSALEETLKNLKDTLEELYLSKKVDAIYAVYSHALSKSSYENISEKLLPLEKPGHSEHREDSQGSFGKSQDDTDTSYIFEPDEKTILGRLIPLFFESKVRQIFLEAFVSEQIARMRAMHQATENASDMIKDLVLERNKARQAAITKELIEIISGSKAAKS